MREFKHNDRVTCTIDGIEITDARISVNPSGEIYICQNIKDGDYAKDKLGYEYSWTLGNDFRDWDNLDRNTCGVRSIKLATSKGKVTKEDESMNVLKKIKELALDADTKLLKKYDVIDEARELTDEGKEVLLQHLFEQNKDAIVAKLKEVDADEKRAKKESK